MATVTVLAAILVFASANLAAAPPAGSALGIVIANGDFRLNDVTVNGNATLTEGAIVETSAVPSRLQLNNGPRIELSTKTRVEVHQDRLILESGMGDLSSPGTYQVEAGAFRIAPATPDSAARVARPAEKVVQVAALKGSVKVYSAKGLLLANVVGHNGPVHGGCSGGRCHHHDPVRPGRLLAGCVRHRGRTAARRPTCGPGGAGPHPASQGRPPASAQGRRDVRRREGCYHRGRRRGRSGRSHPGHEIQGEPFPGLIPGGRLSAAALASRLPGTRLI